MRLKALKVGLDSTAFIDQEEIQKLVVTVLPHYSDYLENNGSAAYFNTLQVLEEKLVSELQGMLSGVENDKATLEQAAEVIRQANALQSKILSENPSLF